VDPAAAVDAEAKAAAAPDAATAATLADVVRDSAEYARALGQLVEARFRIVFAQREINALAHLPNRTHPIDIGLEIRRRNDLAPELHQLLASRNRLAAITIFLGTKMDCL